MATRFYLPSSGAAAVSPSYTAGWEDTTIASRLKCVTTKISSAMTTVSFTDADATNRDVLFRQYVSDPIVGQVISSQTIKFQIRAKERATTCNLFTAWNIKVVSNDGSITRGTITNMERDATEASETTLTNRQETSTSTAVTAHSGDRIVIEIGMGGDPAAGSDHDSDISVGDDSGTDLAENDTDTAANNPWVEFANTLTFFTDGDIIVHEIQDVEAIVTNTSSFSHTVSANLSNRGLLVLVGSYGAVADRHVSTVTYNSVALTQLIETDQGGGGNDEHEEAWLLVNPSTGSNTLVVTMVGSIDNFWVQVVTLGNIAQTGQPDATASDITDDSATVFAVDITTTEDRSFVFGIEATSDFGDIVADSGQITLGGGFTDFYLSSYEGAITPVGTVTHGYSNGHTDQGTTTAVAIKKYVASSGSTYPGYYGSGGYF